MTHLLYYRVKILNTKVINPCQELTQISEENQVLASACLFEEDEGRKTDIFCSHNSGMEQLRSTSQPPTHRLSTMSASPNPILAKLCQITLKQLTLLKIPNVLCMVSVMHTERCKTFNGLTDKAKEVIFNFLSSTFSNAQQA